jgi:hypothetical protein
LSLDVATVRLEDGLPQVQPDFAEFRNLIGPRTVLLGDLLRMELPEIRLIAPGSDWESPLWLLVEGVHGTVAQMAVCPPLLEAMGMARQPNLSVSLLSAVAAQLLVPMLPALRAFFEQDVTVRVVSGSEGCPHTDRWARFRLAPRARNFFSMPCRVHASFACELRDRASTAPRCQHRDVPVPLFVGEQVCSRLRNCASSSKATLFSSPMPSPAVQGSLSNRDAPSNPAAASR